MAWIALSTGFYSAVAHRDNPDLLNVRGRSRVDLDRLADWHERTYPDQPRPELHAFSPADYPWRLFLRRDAFAAFVAQAVTGIDYGNFKNAVDKDSSPARHTTYMGVWSELLRLEREPGALTGHPTRGDYYRRPVSNREWNSSPRFRDALGEAVPAARRFGYDNRLPLDLPDDDLSVYRNCPDPDCGAEVDLDDALAASDDETPVCTECGQDMTDAFGDDEVDAFTDVEPCPACNQPRAEASTIWGNRFRPGSTCPHCGHVEPADDRDVPASDPFHAPVQP